MSPCFSYLYNGGVSQVIFRQVLLECESANGLPGDVIKMQILKVDLEWDLGI